MKTKIISVVFILFFILLNALSLKATHLAGGSITYKCAGGNNYKVALTIYRDCKGIAFAVPTLTVAGCSNNPQTVTYIGSSVIPVLVTPSCPGGPKTACDVPPGTAPGIQRYDYVFNINLTNINGTNFSTCSDVTFSFDVATRNAVISTLNVPGTNYNLYVEAHLYNNAPCHDSPSFNAEPSLFACLNQTGVIDCSAKPSCDSLVYSLTCAKTSNAVCVSYSSGFDSVNFISSSPPPYLDPVTGMLTINPTLVGQVGIYSVLIKQYQNGILVGSIMRDIQLYITSCTSVNHLPQLSGINGTNQYSITMVANKYTCFNIYSSDSDFTQKTSLVSGNELNNVYFSGDTSSNQGGFICVSPLVSDTGSCPRCFSVKVTDTNCPAVASRVYSYCITVVDSGYPIYVNNMDQKYSVTILPNPFSQYTTINLQNFPQSINTQFTLTDIFGRNVMNKKMEKNELVIERGNLAEGIYFYSIHYNNKMIAAGKILIVE